MRRMKTIGELFANLKSYFVNKTNTGMETMAGSFSAQNITANGSFFGDVHPSVPVIKKITSAQAASISLSSVVQLYGGAVYVADSLTSGSVCALLLVSFSSSYTVTMIRNSPDSAPTISSFIAQGDTILTTYLAILTGLSALNKTRIAKAINLANALAGTDATFNSYFSKAGTGASGDPYIMSPKSGVALQDFLFSIDTPSEPATDTYIRLFANGVQPCHVYINHPVAFATHHFYVNVYDSMNQIRPRFTQAGAYSVFNWSTSVAFKATIDINSPDAYYTKAV